MSLYHEAAQVVQQATTDGASLKSRVFSSKGWTSDPKTLFALATEAAKWSEVLSEVIERSNVLSKEKQLTPVLALLLAHDLLLSKRGIALPTTHGLHLAVSRHKVRLTAELTKARVRRGCSSIDALRDKLNSANPDVSSGAHVSAVYPHPRWVRFNTLLTSLEGQLASTFAEYKRVDRLVDLLTAGATEKLLHVDIHVPDLLAVPVHCDLTRTDAYREGKLILQDKASCFPAYLLDPGRAPGDVVDACAAPGNKTTHLASIIRKQEHASDGAGTAARIIACERDAARSETLRSMVKKAGAADVVAVKGNQDFLRLDPKAKEFANVTCLLLDPSCSGSGIVGRDAPPRPIHLPSANNSAANGTANSSKKRKRADAPPPPAKTKIPISDAPPSSQSPADEENEPITPSETETKGKLHARLTALADFQLRLLLHAMAFPAARRITYSTCSIHAEENENVVVRALFSIVARERRWRVLRREEQVEGMRRWEGRGDLDAVGKIVKPGTAGKGVGDADGGAVDAEEVAEACIRCGKGDEEGTMGFFVCGFVRDEDGGGVRKKAEREMKGGREGPRRVNGINDNVDEDEDEDDDEWNGFSDVEP